MYINPEFFVGIINKAVIGGFILVERDDDYWSNNHLDKAFYFHKFVIKDGYGSSAYSKALFDWLNIYLSTCFIPKERVCGKNGKPLIIAQYKL